jgi:hypothetical protein
MPLPIPSLIQGEMFFDYTTSQLWVGTQSHGNQQIPLSTLNGITFPDATVQTTAATSQPVKVMQTASVAVGVIASATPSGIITLNWGTAFADNNYSVVGSVVVAETPSDGAATAICCIGMIQLQAAGVGIKFVVCNADGVPHNVTANFIAIHN